VVTLAISTASTQAGGRRSVVDGVLAGAFALGVIWFFLPLACILILRLPPYAFGHEAVGVRFFEAWVPLHHPGHYPFVMVGFLLDLIHRGLLFALIHTGYAPDRDLIRSMTLFANVSLFIHAVLMALISGVVLSRRALPVAHRILLLITGGSLGFVFYWGPLHLFVPDYPLSLIVAAYMFTVFASTRLGSLRDDQDPVPTVPTRVWPQAVSIALVASAFLLLKPSLLPYAVLAFVVGALRNRARPDWKTLRIAGGVTLGLVALVWFLLQGPYVYAALSSIAELAIALATTTPVEPFGPLRDFVTPETIYFGPLVVSVVWLGITLSALRYPEDRRFRIVPGTILLGGLFYLFVFTRRVGNATTFEILVYLVATATLCATMLHRSMRAAVIFAWCTFLLVQTAAVAGSALPQFVSGAREAAEVAEDVDQYARSFGLPIVYVYPDHGPAPFDIFQSAESAVFKGTANFSFVQQSPNREYQEGIFSLMLPPYRMIGDSESLAGSTAFVLIFADVLGGPGVSADPGVQEALARRRSCRQWEQSRHRIHVCVIPTVRSTDF
jgi:hypothetical protein